MPWNSDLPQGKALGSVTCGVSLTWTLLLVSPHISMKSWWQLWPPALSILYPWSRLYSHIPGLSDSPTKQDPAIRLPGKYFTHSKDCCYSGFCLLWFWLSVVAYTERTNDDSAVEDNKRTEALNSHGIFLLVLTRKWSCTHPEQPTRLIRLLWRHPF